MSENQTFTMMSGSFSLSCRLVVVLYRSMKSGIFVSSMRQTVWTPNAIFWLSRLRTASFPVNSSEYV